MLIHLRGWKTALRQTVDAKGKIWWILPYFRDWKKPIFINAAHMDFLFSTLPVEFAIGGMAYQLICPLNASEVPNIIPIGFKKNNFR